MTKYNELKLVAERLNDAIKNNGYQIEVGHRNNYTAIDLNDLNGRTLRNLEAGMNDKQAISYIHAMIKGIDLISNPINTNNKAI